MELVQRCDDDVEFLRSPCLVFAQVPEQGAQGLCGLREEDWHGAADDLIDSLQYTNANDGVERKIRRSENVKPLRDVSVERRIPDATQLRYVNVEGKISSARTRSRCEA
ncbi:hypothetical protein HPB51_007749 [Rhipicephalus microplus]|uniref:Uncharacterized protein n=1 Tax=Rhipicephalus microplus TaxID=6941 RepID=A0A9J6EFR3_RHIMP|nr:hypothetical protein HPB51_007749 [Rhipicephalus microplus]